MMLFDLVFRFPPDLQIGKSFSSFHVRIPFRTGFPFVSITMVSLGFILAIAALLTGGSSCRFRYTTFGLPL